MLIIACLVRGNFTSKSGNSNRKQKSTSSDRWFCNNYCTTVVEMLHHGHHYNPEDWSWKPANQNWASLPTAISNNVYSTSNVS